MFPLVKDFATSFEADYSSFQHSFRKIQESRDSIILVVELNESIVGYCLGHLHYAFFANGKIGWLEEIAIISDCRRKGLGAQLMIEFERLAKRMGAVLVALATRRAASFYLNMGYQESATYFRKIL